MISLRKAILQVLRYFFLGIVLAILYDYISSWVRGREVMIFEEFIRPYWMVLLFLIALIQIFLVYDWARGRKDEFTKIWEFCKPNRKLTPKDFKIQKFNKASTPRESDIIIENFLKNGDNILILGKLKIGKTRAAYEAIKKLDNFSVIKPRPEEIETEKIRIPPLSNKNFILFLDDFQRFASTNIGDVIDTLKKNSKNLIVVATCRTGEELDLVREEILPLIREFSSVELEEISEKEGKRLAEDLGLQWQPEEFDGTPGSVVLDLEDMKERYKKAGDGKIILKTLKLLWEGNLFIYKETRVKDVCRYIFELPPKMLKRYNWEGIINNLRENGFITKDGDIIDIYTSYLNICVYDYEPSLTDFMDLKNMLISLNDSESLLYLGNGFVYKKDFSNAKDCFLEALRIYPEYITAFNSLGYALTRWGAAKEAKGRYPEAEKLYEEAIEEYRKAIKIRPNIATSHSNLAIALNSLGKNKAIKGETCEARRLYEKAEEASRKAIEINPDSSPAHRHRAFALGLLERDKEAEEEYRESIKLNPKSPFSYDLLGHLLANKVGNYEEAEKLYREAIRIKPDYPSARHNLGYMLTKLGRVDEAEKEYRKAIKACPDYIVAYVSLGRLLTAQKKYKQAVEQHEKALEISSDYVEARNSLGFALVHLNRHSEAEEEFRKAIKIKPDNLEAHRHLGYLLTLMGDDENQNSRDEKARKRYNEAEKEYKKALDINPDDEGALISLGILLERLNRHKEAEGCYKRAIEKNPNSVKAYFTYGYFLSYLGRAEEAMEVLGEAIKIDPASAETPAEIMHLKSRLHAHRGKRLLKSGKFDEAEKELRQAKKLNPNYTTAHKDFGILLKERGEMAQSKRGRLEFYRGAEEAFKKALTLDPKHPSARRHLANLLAKLDRNKEAENEYKEVKKIAANYPKNNRDFGIFLSKTGKMEEARAELELALELFNAKGNEEEAAKTKELLVRLHLTGQKN